MKYYLITDTHFNHKNIIKYCGRPKNFDEIIWKGLSQLNEDDILIHLGDICIGKDKEVHNRLGKFKFKKILVRGNHDKKTSSWYLKNGWDFVCDEFKISIFGKKILFSHKPQEGEYDINIHGHLHNSDIELPGNNKQKLLAIEYTNYQPVNLEKLIQEEILNTTNFTESSLRVKDFNIFNRDSYLVFSLDEYEDEHNKDLLT